MVLSLCVSLGCEFSIPVQLRSTKNSRKVIYGADDRTDYYAHPDAAWKKRTRESAVALIPHWMVDFPTNTEPNFTVASYGEVYNLCSDELFYAQPAASDCSGTLIASDLVLTAGHCTPDQDACEDYYFAFNYFLIDENEIATMTQSDFYNCESLILVRSDGVLDYAIVRLDRAVEDPHMPATVSWPLTGLLENQDITMIGFPSGLPAKIDTGGKVLDPGGDTLDTFWGTPDAFGGNSGSGVYDLDGQIVGILARGATDFVPAEDMNCMRVNRLGDMSEPGEEIVYAARAIQDFCLNSEPDHPELCPEEQAPLCGPCETNAECPDGWSCSGWESASSNMSCVPSCSEDNPCPDLFSCGDEGFCVPATHVTCIETERWLVDTCGKRVSWISSCGDDACFEGACVSAPAGDACDDPVLLEPISQTISFDATLLADRQVDSCGLDGREKIFALSVLENVSWRASAQQSDMAISIRNVCDDVTSQIDCAFMPNDETNLVLLEGELAQGDYYIFISFSGEPVSAVAIQFEITPLCMDGCIEGERRCVGSQVQTCSMNDAGCLDYVHFDTCDNANCMDGFCDSDCTSTCENQDEAYCASSTQAAFCGYLDGDSCLDLEFVDCGPGAICAAGICQPSCTNLCTLGEQRCASATVAEICTMGSADSCTIWTAQSPCGTDQHCEDGICVATCQTDCIPQERRCADDTHYEICQAGLLCSDWGPPTICPVGTTCVEGECLGPCEDACHLEESRCTGAFSFSRCETTLTCNQWSESNYCFRDTICIDGQCAPVADSSTTPDIPGREHDSGVIDHHNDQTIERIAIAAEQGCSASPSIPSGFFLIGLAFGGRRFKAHPKRAERDSK
jgi:hypothetical protein